MSEAGEEDLDSEEERLAVEEEAEAQLAAEEAEGAESEEESESEEEDDSEDEARPPPSKFKNSALAIGYKSDLSFVVRGDMIGVFRNQAGGGKKLKFMTNISGIATPDGKRTFAPSKVMLHEQDTGMVLSDPNNPNSLYRLDLTTGKVVEEYKISDNMEVRNFVPTSKFAQTTGEQTFVGHSHNALFRIDPRLSGSKLVDSQMKQYAGKNGFSAATTTESGRLAVASDKGDIRLFDSIGKNAKTALPALGDPITGVDVSKDGRWVVATTDTYLLLVDTLINDGRYAGSLGCMSSVLQSIALFDDVFACYSR